MANARGLLTVPLPYGKARANLHPDLSGSVYFNTISLTGLVGSFEDFTMAKPEWGTKRSCPKCGERFYDLGKDEPVSCIECGEQWYPEPVLKSKQPVPFEDVAKKPDVEADADLGGDDELEEISDIDEDDDSPDNDVDLGGDDDLGVSTPAGEDDEHDN